MRLLQNLLIYDLRLLFWCSHWHAKPYFMALIRIISRSGDGWVQVLFPILCWWLNPPLGGKFIKLLAIGFAIERPIYRVLKNGCKRRRPPDAIPAFRSLIIASDEFSFPSGHTAAAFLMATMAVLVLGTAALPLFIWATMIAASRVWLGVHFPSDTLAGAILGTTIAFGLHVFIYC